MDEGQVVCPTVQIMYTTLLSISTGGGVFCRCRVTFKKNNFDIKIWHDIISVELVTRPELHSIPSIIVVVLI